MTIQIETSKGRIMAVKVFDNNKQEIAVDIFPLIENRYQIIGKWSHLTEEQAAMIVDNYGNRFLNYKTNDIEFSTALESFASLMHANGKYLVNPLSDEISAPDPDEYREYQEATGEYLILFKPNR